MRQIVLILDDSREITDGLATGLEREGRSVIVCNDVESAEIVLELYGADVVVADLQFSGAFSFEGFGFVNHVKKYAPEAAVILISGFAHPEVHAEAARRGALFLQKPFGLDELERLIEPPPGRPE